MKVVITGGNLKNGEYMVRDMNANQIYETIRDGFKVEQAMETPKFQAKGD